MKCAICGKEIETTFLNKIKGNVLKIDGKSKVVCNICFKNNKNDIKKKVNK